MAPLKLVTSVEICPAGRLVARCHEVSSFSFIYGTSKEVVPFDDIGIFYNFSMMPKCQLLRNAPKFGGFDLNSAEGILHAFQSYGAVNFQTFQHEVMRGWAGHGCLQLGVWTKNPSHDLTTLDTGILWDDFCIVGR